MKLQPKVYIVILNYQSWSDTIECLESLFQLKYENKEIIVVDNASPNNSHEKLINWATENNLLFNVLLEKELGQVSSLDRKNSFSFLKATANRGFASGNNLGIRYVLQKNDHDYIWLLNNDTTVDPNSLAELVNGAETDQSQNKRVGIWGSKLLYFHKPHLIQALGGKLDRRSFTTSHLHEGEQDSASHNVLSLPLDYVVGASLFVSRKFIEEVGLLNEDYFLYFEELDWAERSRKAGFELGYVPTSRVYHKEGSTIGSSNSGKKKSDLADYHGQRSKILFFKTYYPERKFQLLFILSVSVILRLSRFQFKRAISIIKLIYGKI